MKEQLRRLVICLGGVLVAACSGGKVTAFVYGGSEASSGSAADQDSSAPSSTVDAMTNSRNDASSSSATDQDSGIATGSTFDATTGQLIGLPRVPIDGSSDSQSSLGTLSNASGSNGNATCPLGVDAATCPASSPYPAPTGPFGEAISYWVGCSFYSCAQTGASGIGDCHTCACIEATVASGNGAVWQCW